MHVFLATIAEGEAVAEAVVVQLVHGRSLARTLELLYSDHRELRYQASVIIVRTVVEERLPEQSAWVLNTGEREQTTSHTRAILDELAEDPETTFNRANDKPVRLLGSRDFEPILSSNVNPLVNFDPLEQTEISDERILACLREAEMRHIVGKARSILPEAPDRAYEAPSGSLVRSFMRVGNIQYSRASMDALFFWLLPHLRGCHGIVTDTWSISSMALNTSRMLSLYDGSPQVPIEVLSEYQDRHPDRDAGAGEVLTHLLAEISRSLDVANPTILCLISATQTGSLVSSLNEILKIYCGEAVTARFVAVFKMGDSSLEALSDWSDSDAFRPLSSEAYARANAVVIDPQLYFPLIFHDIDYVLRERQAAPGKRFLDDYGRSGIISVHRDSVSDTGKRHHGIYLDCEKLVDHQTFRGRFREKLLGLVPPPTLILSPPHESGLKMALYAQEVFTARGISAAIFSHSTLRFAPEREPAAEEIALRDAIDALPDNGAVLILDDVFITGARLSGYERHLRDRTFSGLIHYLVGVARPTSAVFWEGRKQMRSFRPRTARRHFDRNTIDSVETLFLPNWEEQQCPWCQEQQLYVERSREARPLPGPIADRRDRLIAAAATGMQHDLFMAPPGRDSFGVTPDSLFAQPGVCQAEVFASVASAVQSLRSNPPENRPSLGRRRFPVSTVLNGQEYLFDTYTDTILRSSIIRAADPDELVYANKDSEAKRTQWIRNLIEHPESDEWEISLELLLAAGLSKCTISVDAGVRDALERNGLAEAASTLLFRET